jgi:hypothetical protein
MLGSELNVRGTTALLGRVVCATRQTGEDWMIVDGRGGFCLGTACGGAHQAHRAD